MSVYHKFIPVFLIIISTSCERIENPLDAVAGSGRPSVVTTNPTDGSTTAPLFGYITVIFNEAMDPATVTTNLPLDTTCSGTLQVSSDGFATCVEMLTAPVYSGDNKIFIVLPIASLTGSTNYQVRITTGVADTAGNNMLNNVTTTFTTVIDIVNYGYSNACGTTFTSISPGPVTVVFDDADLFSDPDNEGYLKIPIGFTFKYLSNSFDYIVVTSDGYATFDLFWNHWSIDSKNLYTGVTPNFLLAPWWGDLDNGITGAVYYTTTGTDPNLILTIEWSSVIYYGTNDTFSFQIKLYQIDNGIEFIFGPKIIGTDGTFAYSGISDYYGGENHYRNTFDGATTGMTAVAPYTYADFPLTDSCYSFTPP